MTKMLQAAGYTNEQINDMYAAEESGEGYRCTWSQTGYAYGVYVNNGESCPVCGTPMRLDSRCPKCEAESERIVTEKDLRVLSD